MLIVISHVTHHYDIRTDKRPDKWAPDSACNPALHNALFPPCPPTNHRRIAECITFKITRLPNPLPPKSRVVLPTYLTPALSPFSYRCSFFSSFHPSLSIRPTTRLLTIQSTPPIKLNPSTFSILSSCLDVSLSIDS